MPCRSCRPWGPARPDARARQCQSTFLAHARRDALVVEHLVAFVLPLDQRGFTEFREEFLRFALESLGVDLLRDLVADLVERLDFFGRPGIHLENLIAALHPRRPRDFAP